MQQLRPLLLKWNERQLTVGKRRSSRLGIERLLCNLVVLDLGIDEHPDVTCVVIALRKNTVAALLCPDYYVVCVQHVRDEHLDERLTVVVDVFG